MKEEGERPVPQPAQAPAGRWGHFRQRLLTSQVVRRVFSGAFWSLLGSVGGRGLTLIASIYAARVLGKEGFGEFGIVQSTLSSFSLFAGLSLGLTANKYVAELRETNPARAGRIITLSRRMACITGGVTAVLVFVFAGQLATNAMASPGLAHEIRIAALALFLGAINGAQSGALSGLEAFRTIARITFLAGVFGFLFMVVGVSFAGLAGAVWAMVGGIAANCVISALALHQEAKKYRIETSMPEALKEWRTLKDFSLPAVMAGFLVVPVNWACNLVLVNQPNGYAEMGVLNAAIQWRNIILFVPGVMMSVALPMLANLGATGEHGKQRKVLLMNIVIVAVIGLCTALGVTLLAPQIMGSYGAEFESGRKVLILQAFAAAIAATVGIIGQFLVSAGMMWRLAILHLIWASINLGLTWMYRNSGAEGVSMAYLLAYLVHLGTMSGLTYWKLRRGDSTERSQV